MRKLGWIVVLALSLLSGTGTPAADSGLEAAGATFPLPLYESWFWVYQSLAEVTVSYDPVGSGAGIQRLLRREVDFAATDALLSDEILASAPADVVHIPTCIGAVVITYNLPGIPELRFTPALLADIFSGRVSSWTDRRVVQVNPGLRFPDLPITVVHRSDRSGTTSVFTRYLADTVLGWRDSVGAGMTVQWPGGLAAAGNDGMVQEITSTPGAVGYVERAFAEASGLPTASVKNSEEYFVKPTLEAMTAAARVPLPSDLRVVITNTAAPEGYPISAFTYLILYREQAYDGRSEARARTLARLLWWAVHDGQALTEEHRYAPLPGNVVKRAEAVIRSLTYNGRQIADW